VAVPKKKMTRSRTRKRRTHYVLPDAAVPKSGKVRPEGARSARFFCDNCAQPKQPHTVCPNCGHYRGKALIEVER
jgi:large subunit ribosomal protein L32